MSPDHSDQIHDTAARGFDAGSDAYERARPGYPPECVEYLIEHLRMRTGRVLDLAAGTGKLTRELLARGIECVAVEPVEGMRARFAAALPGIEALDGTAEAIPLPDGSVVAVTVAQAFHWFRHAEAIAEMHRVMGPRGRVGIVFNVRDETHDWVARITEMIAPYEGAGGVRIPRHRRLEWKRPLDDSALLAPVEVRLFPHAQQMTPDDLVDRVASISFVAVLPDDERAQVLEQVRALAISHPDLAGRPSFSFPYLAETHVYEGAE